MKAGPLQNMMDAHTITAGEAAALGIFGMLLPGQGFVWRTSIGFDLRMEVEEWEVEALECYIFTAAGVSYQGRLMYPFAVQPAGQGPVFLPANPLQIFGSRVTLNHSVHVMRGIGVLIRSPVAIATDIVELKVEYRVLK